MSESVMIKSGCNIIAINRAKKRKDAKCRSLGLNCELCQLKCGKAASAEDIKQRREALNAAAEQAAKEAAEKAAAEKAAKEAAEKAAAEQAAKEAAEKAAAEKAAKEAAEKAAAEKAAKEAAEKAAAEKAAKEAAEKAAAEKAAKEAAEKAAEKAAKEAAEKAAAEKAAKEAAEKAAAEKAAKEAAEKAAAEKAAKEAAEKAAAEKAAKEAAEKAAAEKAAKEAAEKTAAEKAAKEAAEKAAAEKAAKEAAEKAAAEKAAKEAAEKAAAEQAAKEAAEKAAAEKAAKEAAEKAAKEAAEQAAAEQTTTESAEPAAEAAPQEKGFKLTAPAYSAEVLPQLAMKRGRKLIYTPKEVIYESSCTIDVANKKNDEGIKVKNILEAEIKEGLKLGYLDKYDGLKSSEMKEEYENDTIYEIADQEFKKAALRKEGDKVKVYIFDWTGTGFHHIGFLPQNICDEMDKYLTEVDKYSFDICGIITGGKYKTITKDEKTGKFTVSKGKDSDYGVDIDITVVKRKD